ncbi:MAG: DUF6798 domain-containing protein [Phycisphaerales bacterium JB059]
MSDDPNTPSKGRPRARGRLFVVLGLALAAMGACGYRFGLTDQTQYLAHYVALRWPGSLEGDLYLEAFSALGSFLWAPLAVVPQRWLPLAAAVLTAGIAGASALVLMGLSRALGVGGRAESAGALALAASAMALVVPKEQNYFGLVSLADVELTATLAVLPLVLGSMACFARGRVRCALLLALAAVPIHGQTAAYALGAWCTGVALCDGRERGRLALALGVGVAGVLGVLWARGIGPVNPDAMGDYETLGRALYAPLIDLWSVPLQSWIALAIVLAMGLSAAPAFLRDGSAMPPPHRSARERLVAYGLGSLAVPALGGLLQGLGRDEPLLWRLMVPRSLMLAQVVSVIIAAVWATDRIAQGGRERAVGALVLLGVILWPAPGAGHLAAGALGALVVGLIAGASLAPRVGGASSVRAGGALWHGLALGVCVVFGVWAQWRSGLPWLRDATDASWRETQRWANENTPRGSRFVTPPYLAGWRIGAHRPTFGELRDGGLMFYAGDPALEWERRMRLLGMDRMRAWWWDVPPGDPAPEHAALRAQYAEAIRERWPEIARESAADYVVMESSAGAGMGDPVWSNGRFGVFRVAGE